MEFLIKNKIGLSINKPIVEYHFFLSFTSRPIQMLRLRRVAAQYKNRGARPQFLYFILFYFTIDCYR